MFYPICTNNQETENISTTVQMFVVHVVHVLQILFEKIVLQM